MAKQKKLAASKKARLAAIYEEIHERLEDWSAHTDRENLVFIGQRTADALWLIVGYLK